MQVEQIDREAGADFMGSIPAFYGQEQPMRDGLHDTSLIVQAFARHRHQARAEQAAELAKFKALAETLAGALGRIARQDMPTHRENGDRWWFNGGEGFAEWATTFATEALRKYKEARDER